MELKNQGIVVSHKNDLRLMKVRWLYSKVRKRRKYSSSKGTIGKIADNLIERNLDAKALNQKRYTDIAEFNLRGEKLCLSPILDGINGEIVSFNLSLFPNLYQIEEILKNTFEPNWRLTD